MKKVARGEIRDLISILSAKLGATGPTAAQFIQTFRAEYPREIASSNDDLVDIALTKLFSDASSRRPTPSIVSGEDDLFSYYKVPALMVLPATGQSGKRELRHWDPHGLTYREVLQWLENHTKQREATLLKYEGVRQLLDRLAPYFTSDTMTIQEALEAEEAANQATAAAEARD